MPAYHDSDQVEFKIGFKIGSPASCPDSELKPGSRPGAGPLRGRAAGRDRQAHPSVAAATVTYQRYTSQRDRGLAWPGILPTRSGWTEVLLVTLKLSKNPIRF